MLEFWLKRDLNSGLYNTNAVEIVEVHYADGEYDGMEPSLSLDDIEAIMGYIQRQFPDGWRIADGEIRGCLQ